MMTIIDTMLSVGQKLFSLREELSQAREARKQVVAEFLDAIAETIEDASAQLKQGHYPHGKCQELVTHSQHMEEAIGVKWTLRFGAAGRKMTPIGRQRWSERGASRHPSHDGREAKCQGLAYPAALGQTRGRHHSPRRGRTLHADHRPW